MDLKSSKFRDLQQFDGMNVEVLGIKVNGGFKLLTQKLVLQ